MNTPIITIRTRHTYAGFSRTNGLWSCTTLGWWTWQTTRAPKPIVDRVVALLGVLLGSTDEAGA